MAVNADGISDRLEIEIAKQNRAMPHQFTLDEFMTISRPLDEIQIVNSRLDDERQKRVRLQGRGLDHRLLRHADGFRLNVLANGGA